MYRTNFGNYIKPLALLAVFVLFFLTENRFPLRNRRFLLTQRLFTNIAFSALTFFCSALVVSSGVGYALQWEFPRRFGMVHLLPLSSPGRFLLGFLLLDLTFYYWHRLNHKHPLLRRFHRIHHIDPDLDVFTSFRFHFAEILYSVVFRVLQTALTGVSLFTLGIYEFVFACATIFHHSNLYLPLSFEQKLNKALVTPRMHGIHHSSIKKERDSNYSVIFSWWDRMHCSLLLNIEQKGLVIGVAGYLDIRDNTLRSLLLLPFGKQKPLPPPARKEHAATTEQPAHIMVE